MGVVMMASGTIPSFPMLVSCVAYVAASVTSVLFPQYLGAVTKVTLPLGSGELFMLLWLFIKGVRMQTPPVQPSYAT